MTRFPLLSLLASLATIVALHGLAHAAEADTEVTVAKAGQSGYVPANGIDYYYEIRGEGEPLLLLHGGLGTMDMFAPVMPILAGGRQVIAVDLHGHGRTALGERPIDFVDIGNDLAEVLDGLGYETVDVLGYSFGASAGLRLAVQHPQKVRRIAIVSAGFARDGFFPEMLPMQAALGAGMAEAMAGTPMHAAYMAVAPDPQEFPRLLDAMGALMRTPYDWAEDVRGLKMPVMLVYGDSDMIRPQHIVDFYGLLGGGLRDAGWMRENMPANRLAILPDLTHYEIFMAPEMARATLRFLDGVSGGPNWAAQTGAD